MAKVIVLPKAGSGPQYPAAIHYLAWLLYPGHDEEKIRGKFIEAAFSYLYRLSNRQWHSRDPEYSEFIARMPQQQLENVLRKAQKKILERKTAHSIVMRLMLPAKKIVSSRELSPLEKQKERFEAAKVQSSLPEGIRAVARTHEEKAESYQPTLNEIVNRDANVKNRVWAPSRSVLHMAWALFAHWQALGYEHAVDGRRSHDADIIPDCIHHPEWVLDVAGQATKNADFLSCCHIDILRTLSRDLFRLEFKNIEILTPGNS